MPIATIKTRHKNQHIEAIILNGKKIGYVEKTVSCGREAWRSGDTIVRQRSSGGSWIYFVRCKHFPHVVGHYLDMWAAVKNYCLARSICFVTD